MRTLPFDGEFYRSVDRKLRTRYLRWLSTHKPDYFWFHPVWRGFWRAYRRAKYSVAKWFLPLVLMKYAEAILSVSLFVVVLLFVSMLDVRAVAAVGYEFLGTITTIPSGVFLGKPAEWSQISPDLDSAIPFGRLTLFQTALAVLIVVAGMPVSSLSDMPDRRFRRRADKRRDTLGVLRFWSIASLLVSFTGAWYAPRDMPNALWGVLTTGIVGLAIAWLAFQVAIFLGTFRLLLAKETREVAVAVVCLSCLFGVFILCISSPSIALFGKLEWLGPIGWLNYQAMQIGTGNFSHALPLGLAISVLVAASIALRWKSHTWEHRRKVLAVDSPPIAEEKTVISKPSTDRAGLCRFVLDELSNHPTTWREWILPAWFRERRGLIMLLLPLVAIVQAMAIFYSILFAQYGDMAFPVDQDPRDLVRFLLLGSIVLAILLIEFGQGILHAGRTFSAFAKRPISAWGLWRELQWEGLVRIPTILFWIVPWLIIPFTMLYREWWLVPLTVGLSLSAWAALRTLLAAVTIIIDRLGRLPELWQAFLVLPLFIPMMTAMLCFSSSVPDLGGLWPLWIRQLTAHGATLAQFGIAYGIWRWTGRLAREPASRAGE